MIKRIVAFALFQPLFLLLLAGLFIVGGIVAFKSLPIEAFPDVTDIQVAVISLFPGHAAEEVEKQVTIPVEIALSGLPHSVRLFSHTQFGLSFVIATFDDQVSDYFARQQVLERLQGIALPPGVQPTLAPLSTPIGEIYRYRLQGEKSSPAELQGIPGLGGGPSPQDDPWGGRYREFRWLHQAVPGESAPGEDESLQSTLRRRGQPIAGGARGCP